jgi:hypothetical protein
LLYFNFAENLKQSGIEMAQTMRSPKSASIKLKLFNLYFDRFSET